MVPPVPPRKAAALPIIGWIAAVLLIIASAVVLFTVIRGAGHRQEKRTVDVTRLYAHCKLVREAMDVDARDLLDPAKKDAALTRFGEAPLHTVREIQLCARQPVDLAAREGCVAAKDYGCLVFLARQAHAAVSVMLSHEP